ncbi:RNA-binding protein 12B-like [Dendrobates tinctorius]|uniref:RNA-binding protein 12B-like n=1 Tax=Dendrobates tinctorius TaxID=92724 RepID=UPI003CCA1E56
MSLTVRLEGLPPIADAIHIRRFFTGLKIRDGGVTIIGGVYGEAYVTFEERISSCLALNRSGKFLMNSPINISAWCSSPQTCSYLRIMFTPLNAKLSHVKSFFTELYVENVIFMTRYKVRSGIACVKFGKGDDAEKALLAFQASENKNCCKSQNTFSVLSMWPSSEMDWLSHSAKCDSSRKNLKNSTCKWLPKYDHHLLYIHEFYAHLVNVSLHADKSLIRKFLHNLVEDSQITFVYDKNGNRQRECFVMFVTENDYVRALELDKAVFRGRRLRVLPVSKANMMDLIESKKNVVLGDPGSEDIKKKSGVKFLYLRNFAACVNKYDILNFFSGFSLTEQDICLLYDDNGDCLGEAIVKFSKKEEASEAEKLNHNRFQDTEILLRCVSKKQLKAFGVYFIVDHSTANQKLSTCEADISVSEADESSEVTCDAGSDSLISAHLD